MREEKLRNYLKNKGLTPFIKIYDVVGSTNDEAKKLCREFDGEGLIIADGQTNGRGRQGHTFYSPSEKGLYFTIILRPRTSLSDSTPLTAAAALAVVEALEDVQIKNAAIKWVNDIFIGDRKICGILAESVFVGGEYKAAVVGIGINVTTESFPDEIKDVAGSIGKEIDRDALAAEIFIKLKNFSDALPDRSFMEKYAEKCFILGREISFTRDGKDYAAIAESIDENGALIVSTSDGQMALQSGEISIRF